MRFNVFIRAEAGSGSALKIAREVKADPQRMAVLKEFYRTRDEYKYCKLITRKHLTDYFISTLVVYRKRYLLQGGGKSHE
jgi:hypothetical protein